MARRERSAAQGRRDQNNPQKGGRRGGGPWGKFWRGFLLALVTIIIVLPVGLTLVYRFIPPPITILMIERLFQGQGLDHRWRSLASISPGLPRAAIASEDANFCTHHGFDFSAMEKAYAHNQDSSRVRGGSTISQQTAKNVFLWPDRSYVRKGVEAYFTVLIETLWGKKRIMEVYLNTIEMGPGLYGAEAASQRYFHHGADKLTPQEAARLVAILPSPLRYNAVKPGPYVARRTATIGARAGVVKRDDYDACLD